MKWEHNLKEIKFVEWFLFLSIVTYILYKFIIPLFPYSIKPEGFLDFISNFITLFLSFILGVILGLLILSIIYLSYNAIKSISSFLGIGKDNKFYWFVGGSGLIISFVGAAFLSLQNLSLEKIDNLLSIIASIFVIIGIIVGIFISRKNKKPQNNN